MVTRYLGLGFAGFGVLWLIIGAPMMLARDQAGVTVNLGRIFALIGVAFLVGGALTFGAGLLSSRAARQTASLIETQGISVKGTVNRVQPNWNIRLNGRPVYSIVEFTFTDSSGAPRQVRKTRIDSGLVADGHIAQGAQVDVKYLMADPRQCGLVLTDDMGQTKLVV